MFTGKPYKYLSEAATADLLDPGTSEEVKDTIEELQDDLTNNVEEVPADDMVTNGGVPVITAESAILAESSNGRYYISMEAVMRICEDEAEVAADGEEPTADEVVDQADNVIDQIANANGIDPEDVTVVISADEMTYMCECAINESKCNKKKGKKKGGKSAKKIAILSKLTKALKGKVKVAKKK